MVILSIISGLLMLGLQFYSIASDKILNDIIYNGQHSGIAIKFFSEWSLITKNVFIDILKSFAFPVIFSIIYFKNLKKDISFWYVFALFIVALLIWLFVIETGPRYSHANFVWQLVVCNYIWFLYSIMKFYKYLDIKSFKINIFDILIILVFMFHFFSGIYYGYYIVKIGDFL